MLLRNAKTYVGQYDLSGDHNMVAVNLGCEAVNDTRMGHTTKVHVAGLFENSMSGQVAVAYGTGASDTVLQSKIGVANTPITISPDGGDAGEVAYFMQALEAEYAPFGVSVGQLHVGKWSAQGDGGHRMPRGIVFIAAGSRTASVNSSVIELGAASSSQRLFAALHVISASGTTPTLDVVVKSDDGAGFGTPTSRITFTQAIAATAEWKSLAGAITDTHYRVDLTIGGTNPDFSCVVVVGIA